MITIDSLNKRYAELLTQEEQLLANLNAVAGAKQEIENLITELSDPSKQNQVQPEPNEEYVK